MYQAFFRWNWKRLTCSAMLVITLAGLAACGGGDGGGEAGADSKTGGGDQGLALMDVQDAIKKHSKTGLEIKLSASAGKTKGAKALNELVADTLSGDSWALCYLVKATVGKRTQFTKPRSFEGEAAPAAVEKHYRRYLAVLEDPKVEFTLEDLVPVHNIAYAFVEDTSKSTPQALRAYGMICSSPQFIRQPDYQRAAKLLGMAADGQDAEAQARYGALLILGRGGLKQDLNKAYKLISQSAKQGHSYGMSLMGRAKLSGWGTEFDKEGGLDWLRKAEALGEPDAMMYLGWAYLSGLGVEKDPKRGFALYQQAADGGYGPALYYLAESHYSGFNRPKNQDKAIELWDRAAKVHQDGESMKRLAKLRLNRKDKKRFDLRDGRMLAYHWADQNLSKHDAEQWAAGYRSAKWVTKAEFFKLLPAVKVEVTLGDQVKGFLGLVSARNEVEKAVKASGLKIDPSAEVTLRVEIDGFLKNRTHSNTLFQDLSFVVNAPVRRGDDHWVPCEVALVDLSYGSTGRLSMSRSAAQKWVRNNTEALLDAIKSGNDTARQWREDKWKASLWPKSQDTNNAIWYASVYEMRGLFSELWFSELDHYAWSWLDTSGMEKAYRYAPKKDFEAELEQRLKDSSLQKDPASPFYLKHSLLGMRYQIPFSLDRNYAHIQRLSWYQENIVFKIGETWIRRDGRLTNNYSWNVGPDTDTNNDVRKGADALLDGDPILSR